MASNRTLAKRIAERRTWTVTTLRPNGKWYQMPWNLAVAHSRNPHAVARLPNKRQREAMRVLAEAARDPEKGTLT